MDKTGFVRQIRPNSDALLLPHAGGVLMPLSVTSFLSSWIHP